MNLRLSVVSLLFVTVTSMSPAWAAAPAPDTFVEKLGSLQVTLPLPPGFAEPANTPRELSDVIERNFGPKQRFMAMIVQSEFLARRAAGDPAAEASRYFIIHTFRGVEDSGMSRSAFEFNKKGMREQGAQDMKKAEVQAAAALERASKEVAGSRGDPAFSTKVLASSPLGIFDETPNSISFATIGPVVVTNSHGTEQADMIRIVAFVLVHDRPINLLGYAIYHSPADLAWIEEQTRAWVRRVDQLNR